MEYRRQWRRKIWELRSNRLRDRFYGRHKEVIAGRVQGVVYTLKGTPWRREIVKTDLRNLIVGLFFYIITLKTNQIIMTKKKKSSIS